MAPTQKSPDISLSDSGDDTGARLAHLQDLIAEHAGAHRHALVADYHEAAAAGAMHAVDDEGVILVTLLTRDGESHVYALTRSIAAHLRQTLIELRQAPSSIVTKHPKCERVPVTKPGGRLL
jgi:hypothetical protein